MDLLDRLIDRSPSIPSTLTGEEAHARFLQEPHTQVIVVVDEHAHPLGLLERNAFLLRMATDHYPTSVGDRPVSRLVEAGPPTLDIGTPVDAVRREVLNRAWDPTGRFIVTREGRYLGVGAALSLLQDAGADDPARANAHFLDTVSRDLGAPLSGVLAMAELLERQRLPADAQTCVRTIVESVQTLLRSLSDAAELARAERQGLELSPGAAPLRELMDEVQALWLPRATAGGLALSVNYAGQPGLAAELDAGRLSQMFGVLIGEALKVTRRGGVEAGLQASKENGRVRLQGFVRDIGPRVDTAGPRASREGLELALCRRIADAMGARIWAENNTGAGAVVRFELEAPVAKATAAETAAEQAQAAPVLGGHVLIVDDNATNRMVAQTLIEMFGCTVETAEDGIEAVEAVKRDHFDVILMDIRMPRMDGVAATRAIRALPGSERATPIIALTANADPDDAKHYLASGMASVVEKPIKAERLLGAMLEVLGAAPARSAVAAA